MGLRGVRGATTVEENLAAEIQRAARELLSLMCRINEISSADIASVTLTSTTDLDATFPAEGARQLLGSDVPLLCAGEIAVPGATPRCIRVLIHWNTDKAQKEIVPVYLGRAKSLIQDAAPAYDAEALEVWVNENAPRIEREMQQLQQERGIR